MSSSPSSEGLFATLTATIAIAVHQGCWRQPLPDRSHLSRRVFQDQCFGVPGPCRGVTVQLPSSDSLREVELGWSFRKRVGFAKLLRLNFSSSGVSLGLGPPGLNVNIGSKGVRTTVGLPGSGLSYRSFKSWEHNTRASRKEQLASEMKSRADAMVAGWRKQFVGNVYESDASQGPPRRFIITDVRLGQEGPLTSIAFNPRTVEGVLTHDAAQELTMAEFAKYALWKQIGPESRTAAEAAAPSADVPAAPGPSAAALPPAPPSARSPLPFVAVVFGLLLAAALLQNMHADHPSATAAAPPAAPPAETVPRREAAVEPALSDVASIREIQSLLKELGFDAGPTDGIDGPLTHGAIHRYLAAKSLTGNDLPTATLLNRLRSERTARR